MTGGWPACPVYSYGIDCAANTAASIGTVVTTGAANTKGSWTTVDASTASDISRIIIMLDNMGGGGYSNSYDFAVGASGNESSGILIQNLVMQCLGNRQEHLELVVDIKAGSRIACRCASDNSADNMRVQVIGFDTGFTESLNCDLYDTYGWSGSGNISGITLDPGTTQNTKGAYSVVTASSTNDLSGFMLGFDTTGFVPTVGAPGHSLIDIAVGASGQEKIIVPNYYISKNNWSGGMQFGPSFSPRIWIPIKAGTRIAARMQSENTTASERLIGLSLYGMRA